MICRALLLGTLTWHFQLLGHCCEEEGNVQFVVADDGKNLGGMGYAAMSRTEPKIAILHQLYVLPQYQGQGIGRDMFAELETCDAGLAAAFDPPRPPPPPPK